MTMRYVFIGFERGGMIGFAFKCPVRLEAD